MDNPLDYSVDYSVEVVSRKIRARELLLLKRLLPTLNLLDAIHLNATQEIHQVVPDLQEQHLNDTLLTMSRIAIESDTVVPVTKSEMSGENVRHEWRMEETLGTVVELMFSSKLPKVVV